MQDSRGGDGPEIELSEAAAPEVSVLIPAASQPETLAAMLAALAGEAASGAVSFETVLVLNDATPEVRAVAGRAGGVRRRESPINLGVAGGYNFAREGARGLWLALVHDDVVPEPGWLGELLSAAAANPACGVVGSVLLHPDGRLQRAGSLVWRDGRTSLPWPGPPPPLDRLSQVEAADYVGTASMLVRAELWDAVGGADETFHPGYYVDADLCFSARAAGRTVLLAGRSRVRHHQGLSTSPRYREFVVARSRARFVAKWPGALAERPEFDGQPSSFAEARERVRREAERIAGGGAPGPASTPLPSAPEERVLRLARAEADSRTSFARVLEELVAQQQGERDHLAASLEATEREREVACARLARERSAHERTKHRLTRVLAFRRWRRRRLRKPLERLLRGLRGLFRKGGYQPPSTPSKR